MKDQRSDLTNDEILDLEDEDFDTVFESCKQEVSQYDEEQARLQEEQAAAEMKAAEDAGQTAEEAAPSAENAGQTAEETAPSAEESKPASDAQSVKKESYFARIQRKCRMNLKGEERKPKRSKDADAAPRSVKQEVYDWIQTIVLAMVACIIVFTFLVRIVGVDGRSMVPTLQHGDKLIVSNLGYTPERGDIVILRKDTFMQEPIVKRVIALEGEEVRINFARGIVYVDGMALEEPYVNVPTQDEQDYDGPVVVPENCVFVMGDNRNDSTDSRTASLGCVDVRYIIGKVHWIAFPGVDQFGERQLSRIGSPYAVQETE